MTRETSSPPTAEEWREFVEACPDATVYHTLGWRRAGAVLGHVPRPLVVRDSSGSLAGVLPLFAVGRGRSARLVAVPLRDRGGPLATHDAAAEALMRRAADLAGELGAGRVTLRSHIPLTEVAQRAGYSETRYHVTTLVDLSGGEDATLKAVKGSARRSATKGGEAGLRFRWGEGEADLRSFYQLFLRTRRKLGVPPYPWRFFSAMREHLGDSVRVGLASLGGSDVASVLLFAYGDRVIDGYAASDERHLSLQPNDFLIWNVLGWAAREGYRYFDFGASSPHQKGLLFFKEKWGGNHVDLYTYAHPESVAESAVLDSNRPEFDTMRKVWRRLPLWVTRLAAAPIVRRLD